MTAQYSMTFAQVNAVVQDLFAASRSIQEEMQKLDGDVKRLMSQWDGSAVEAYGVAQRDWNQAIATQMTTLQSAGSTLEAVAGNTLRVEQQNTAMFGGR
ncbi:WXG100 family type VII secretion target [Streptomyces mirabilis]|uniref:WXG100 family type VII secretion target n=1 Tax=Streptomyces mirabilis TaxID=68239 RepID=UPI0037FCF904